MNLFALMETSGSALEAERMRAEVVAANMANAETTRTPQGVPYRRQHVVFAANPGDREFSTQLGAAILGGGSWGGGSLGAGSWGGGSSSALLLGAPTLPTLPMPEALGGAAGAWTSAINVAPGVHVAAVVEDTSPALKRYDPGHPDADKDGYVAYPDINPLTEMVDLMGATRAYGLNSSAVQAEKGMIASALDIAK